MAFLTCGVLAQSKTSDNTIEESVKTRPLVVKTVSVESTAYKPFIATAYSLRGRMANGQTVHSGAIAADPRILKLGTKVHIEGLGVFIVKDTGRLIKGNRLDIWLPNKQQAIKFGKRVVKLRVLS